MVRPTGWATLLRGSLPLPDGAAGAGGSSLASFGCLQGWDAALPLDNRSSFPRGFAVHAVDRAPCALRVLPTTHCRNGSSGATLPAAQRVWRVCRRSASAPTTCRLRCACKCGACCLKPGLFVLVTCCIACAAECCNSCSPHHGLAQISPVPSGAPVLTSAVSTTGFDVVNGTDDTRFLQGFMGLGGTGPASFTYRCQSGVVLGIDVSRWEAWLQTNCRCGRAPAAGCKCLLPSMLTC